MFVPATAWSIRPRHAATRAAVASAPPGLLTYRTWALPAVARATKSDSRSGTYANGSPGLAGCPIPGSGSGGGPLVAARGGDRDRGGDQREDDDARKLRGVCGPRSVCRDRTAS